MIPSKNQQNNQKAALKTPTAQEMARNLSAAEVAGLRTLRPVYVKEVAEAAGVSESTVRAAMHLWEKDPANVRALPYLRPLGRPYRTTLEAAQRFISGGIPA